MDEDGTARFADGRDFRGGDDAVLEFRSRGCSGDDVVGFRHELIIKRVPCSAPIEVAKAGWKKELRKALPRIGSDF